MDWHSFGDQVRSAMKPLTQGEMLRRLVILNSCEASSLAQIKAVPVERRASLDKLGIFSGRIQHLRENYMFERSVRYLIRCSSQTLRPIRQEDESESARQTSGLAKKVGRENE